MAFSSKLIVVPIYLSVAILFVCDVTNGVITFAGKCPNLEPLSNLDLNLIKGEWFENRNYNPSFQSIDRCIQYTFSKPFGPYIPLVLSGKNSQSFQSSTIDGTATRLGPKGVLSVKFPTALLTPVTYYVISTDYVSYAILWNCVNTGIGNVQNAILLTRTQNPDPYIVEAALRETDGKHLSRYLFKPVDQSFC